MNNQKMYAAITIDFDPDMATLTENKDDLNWSSISSAQELFEEFSKANIPTTSFLRMDDQIKDIKGEFSYLYNLHKPLWESLLSQGSEIGLHSHLFRFCNERKGYIQSYHAEENCDQMLRIHNALVDENLKFNCIRIGESHHSLELMQLISQLGYKIDSTAIPGRFRLETRVIDWSDTPNYPYYPSINDHRVPGNPHLKLLEIPMTSMYFKADYDDGPKLRYASLTFRDDIFKNGLNNYLLKNYKEKNFFVVFIIHPGELALKYSDFRINQLYGNGIQNVLNNVFEIKKCAARLGIDLSFYTLSNLSEIFLYNA
jgi:hypothetical protein